MSPGPDLYKRRLATSIEDWNEHKVWPRMFPYPLRRKMRVFSRLEKRRARQMDRAEILRSL